MKTWRVRYSRPALADLRAILEYVAGKSSISVAEGFVLRLQRACDDLATAPHRGTARDDLAAGLRTTGIERRVTVMFRVREREGEVVILGVVYGGRDLGPIANQRSRKA